MKDFKEIIKDLDKKTDKIERKTSKIFKKIFPIFSITLLSLLVIFFIARVYREKPYFVTSVIANDIRIIVNALNKIDRECSILSIENQRNYIDFLNVIKFTGSEVGCLNLAYPEKWQGPYVKDNPTMQGKLYEIIKNKEGVYVVPGVGVKLPNGFKVGKDFELSFDSSVDEMLKDGGFLNYKGLYLAAKLKFEIGDWGREELRKKRLESFNDALEEFNQAMPFTQNETCSNKFILND
ncbi:hypothetical protein GF385_03730 [Candidatus Dependentiae bacterium]|nr:hypothetical protein [Candidatus Dependentiae bacterium]